MLGVRRPKLRQTLEDRGIGYALAVACSHQIRTAAGKIRADTLAARLPGRAWQRLSAGESSKGPRFYDWARITIEPPRCRRPRAVVAVDPVQQRHRRAGLPPLLVAGTRAAARPGPRRRPALDDRGVVPGKQDPHRARPAPRSAAGPTGSGGPSSRCLPTPSSPPSPRPSKPTTQHHKRVL